MKHLMMLALLACALPAQAETIPATLEACEAFLPCGTYVGTNDSKEREGVVTTIEISRIDPTNVKMVYTLIAPGKEDDVWELDFAFEPNGSFKATARGDYNYANGICGLGACTYGMHPFKHRQNGELVANSGMFLFDGDTLEYIMNVSIGGVLQHNRTTLKKQ